jgi:PPOX class probable F420-dependent enzyme
MPAAQLPDGIRALLEGPVFVHLATLRGDGSPRNWVVWAGLENDLVLVCTDAGNGKAKDMIGDPRVGLSFLDPANPYHSALIEGQVAEVRPDPDCRYMDQLALKYTGAQFPYRTPDRLCFAIEPTRATERTLGFTHSTKPG